MVARPLPLAVVDIDGTLVDSNYQHALAWHRALRAFGAAVPLWRIHRSIGMGGDRIVNALGGQDLERAHGDEVREREGELFGAMIDEVVPLPGARRAIQDLAEASRGVVLASSARASETEHHIDLVGVRDVVLGWTTAADVASTKPAPDLVLAAIEKGGGLPAVMVGDATWDIVAATQAGVPAVGVLSGGYSAAELRDAGAEAVFATLDGVVAHLSASATADG